MTHRIDELREILAPRYRILRELGSGGMGTVYEVHDTQRDEIVALKTLHWPDPAAVYQFKKEFRTLADVAHPNLVQLHELVAHDETWFFTMEHVDGVDFLQYVRPSRPSGALGAPGKVELAAPLITDAGDGEVVSTAGTGVLDAARLRTALVQLVRGVAALHAAGKVHRDLKPSNVLVSVSGRVVILDFGISSDVAAGLTRRTQEGTISGTVAYMSPEQAGGERCAPASDWYSVGVLLYEALTGTLPFSGSVLGVLSHKQLHDAPHPNTVAADLPQDLVELCVALLAREPSRRPPDDEILGRLQAAHAEAVIEPQALAEEAPFLGRTAELAALEDAFEFVLAGRAASVCVYGPSGIGKTSLVRTFTEGLVRDRRAAVLAGRCYLRESVPYKALDGVIDMLGRLLRRLPTAEIEAELPRDAAALARVFPVLEQVEAIARLPVDDLASVDRSQLRRRAFAALLEILDRVSRRTPVVVHMDDLQWVDRDSITVLGEMLRSAVQPRLLLIFSFRSEEIVNVPFLAQLVEEAELPARRVLGLGPLTDADAAEFARRMLSASRPDAALHAETLARESDGNPFLLDLMVRYALSTERQRTGAPTGLREMLTARTQQMPDGAQELIEVLAVAGQPVDADLAYRVAGLSGDERRLVNSLRIAHLLRASARDRRIEVYHDRIRDHCLRDLTPHRTSAIHRRLAEAMEHARIDDPESLYEHWLGAGESGKAASFAAQAADAAQTALAFERAALFYTRALDLGTGRSAEIVTWYTGLGDALANAGRGHEAAQAYLSAAGLADARTTLELERRAGQQLLIVGRIREGMEVLARVLKRVGLRMPRSPRRAFLTLILRRIRVELRGLEYTERPEGQVPQDRLSRIDTCWAVAEGLALVDNIQGAAMQTLHLLLALDAGESHRIARALAMEAGFVASSGTATAAAALLARAQQLATRLGSARALGLCETIAAVSAYHRGDWRTGVQHADAAGKILSQTSMATWPLNIARVYHIWNLAEGGDIAELTRVSREFLRDGEDRGDYFAASYHRTAYSILQWLCPDDVAGARAALEQARGLCSPGGYYMQRYFLLLAQLIADLYADERALAWQHVSDDWPHLQRSLILRINSIRIRCLYLRATCAVAAAAGRDRDRLLAMAERDAQRIEREKHYSARTNKGRARLVRSAIAVSRGDLETGLRLLTEAEAGFEASRSALWHALAKRRRGQIVGGDEGRALIAAADAWMAGQGIVRPDRMMAALTPSVPE